MLELTKRINDSGMSRFKVGLLAGINPKRIEAIEHGDRYHYSEIGRLGTFFKVNGYELMKEVGVGDYEQNRCKVN